MKSKYLQVRTSAVIKEMSERLCKYYGMNESELVRYLILREAERLEDKLPAADDSREDDGAAD